MKAALEEGVERFGRLDIVSGKRRHLHDAACQLVTKEAGRDIIDVNLTGTWHTCKAAVPILVEQGTGGWIIISDSTAGLTGMPNIAHYFASKHGVVGIMRTMVIELGPHNIRVNTVHPTGVSTPMVTTPARLRQLLPNTENPTVEAAAKVVAKTTQIPTRRMG